jgi:hypothetical protein
MGHRGNAYAFEHSNFDGRFAALNVVSAGGSSWWSYIGDALNDKVSSSLIVARAPQAAETEVALRQQVASRFASLFDAETAGTQLSRSGDPRVYGTFFPDDDPTRIFATINQDLNVEINNWPDYDANVRYDIEFYLSSVGHLRGYARWSRVWVESGIFHDKVLGEIAPRLHAAKSKITSAIQAQLAAFSTSVFSAVYLLPGPVPDMSLNTDGGPNQFGFVANYDDDLILVVVS